MGIYRRVFGASIEQREKENPKEEYHPRSSDVPKTGYRPLVEPERTEYHPRQRNKGGMNASNTTQGIKATATRVYRAIVPAKTTQQIAREKEKRDRERAERDAYERASHEARLADMPVRARQEVAARRKADLSQIKREGKAKGSGGGRRVMKNPIEGFGGGVKDGLHGLSNLGTGGMQYPSGGNTNPLNELNNYHGAGSGLNTLGNINTSGSKKKSGGNPFDKLF